MYLKRNNLLRILAPNRQNKHAIVLIVCFHGIHVFDVPFLISSQHQDSYTLTRKVYYQANKFPWCYYCLLLPKSLHYQYILPLVMSQRCNIYQLNYFLKSVIKVMFHFPPELFFHLIFFCVYVYGYIWVGMCLYIYILIFLKHIPTIWSTLTI